MTIALFLLFLLLWLLLCVILPILGSVDAIGFAAPVWAAAGRRRTVWVWQAAGVLFAPVAVVYSCVYFLRVRPGLLRAQRDVAAPFPALPDPAAVQAAEGATSIRIRIPVGTRLFTALLVILFPALSVYRSHGHDQSFVLPYAGATVLLSLLLQRWFGITLTPTDAIVHGLWRRRVRWDDVGSVVVERNFGSRRVALWTYDGRRIPLRAPLQGIPPIGRRRFEREFDTVGQWWLRHRGSPPPAVPRSVET